MIQLSQSEKSEDDKVFLEFLKLEKLKKTYETEIDKINQQIKKEFEDPDEYKAKFKLHDTEIIRDRNHRQVVNACIYPFSQGGILTKLGYHFIRTEPLLETKNSDVDFLIGSSAKQIAIFGEAKTSTVNSHNVISEMKTRVKTIEKNRQYLQEVHIPNSQNFEFVFGTHAIETRDLYAKVVESGEKFICWQYGGYDRDDNVLSIYVPENTPKETRKRVMHEDNELNRNLVRVSTNIAYKNLLPKSHPMAKLSVLTWIDKQSGMDDDKTEGVFTLKDVLKIFENELENFPSYFIEDMANKTIADAIKIGFVKQLDGNNYKIISMSSDPAARYEDLKRKWIDYYIKQEKNKKLEDLRIKLQAKLREEKLRQQPPLDPYLQQ